MDISSISAAITALLSAKDLVKSAASVKEFADNGSIRSELLGKLSDAYSAVLESKAEQLALQDKLRTLQEEVDRHMDWQAQKERYELTIFSTGTFAYALKAAAAGNEPFHCLCTTCYEAGKRSILHQRETIGFHLECKVCNTSHYIGATPAYAKS